MRRTLLLCVLVSFPAAAFSASQDEPLPEGEALKALPRDGGERFNRLVFETSPYLRQHARNPVNWYPWGDEAFRVAQLNKKPVFLSVGYSTCHWCHVMEHESFEDPQVAALMNQAFVCIKVDREERPDVDAVYMQVTQALTGRGGWPNTILMTPEGKPFFAATYLPPRGRYGRMGMVELIERTSQAWRDDRENLGNTADEISRILAERVSARDPGELTVATLQAGIDALSAAYDAEQGGFGAAPKFPVPHRLTFLLRQHQRDGHPRSLEMVTHQLDAMRDGGIWDQVGHGFHPYSTDREWFLPHFEKMLYDQALITSAYVEAFQVTGDEEYARTVREALGYVERRLSAPEGGFYSAEDADSEGEEGIFYIWNPEQLEAVLGTEDARLAAAWYGVVEGGNYVDEGSGKKNGSSVLHRPHTVVDFAQEHGLEAAAWEERLESIRLRLFEAREGREFPFRDDKVLTDWNGLAIATFAQAARALGEDSYAERARRAADFAYAHLRQEDGRLFKLWRAGEASGTGMLADYAYLAHGLLELYGTTFEPRDLRWALELSERMLSLFWDEVHGGLFLSPSDGESLILRPKEAYDGATPSGNSMAASVFVRLARLTGRTDLEERADAIFRCFAGEVNGQPASHAQLLTALDYVHGPTYELVVALPQKGDGKAALAPFRAAYLPRVAIVVRPHEQSTITDLAPFTASQEAQGDAVTFYLCQNFTCDAPTADGAAVLERLAAPAALER